MTRKVGDNADPQLTDLFEVNSWFRSYHLRRTTRKDERTRELDDNEELLGLKAIKKINDGSYFLPFLSKCSWEVVLTFTYF